MSDQTVHGLTVEDIARLRAKRPVKARKLITIEGEQRPYDQGEWVVYNPQGEPTGCMRPSAASGDDPVKAAKEFWETGSEALEHLAKGYRIELMSRDRWEREIYPLMFSGARKAAAASSGETR